MSQLSQMVVLIGAALILVPLSRRLGLGSVVGYLAAGILLGPFGLKLIDGVDGVLHFAEFGVVLLLFLIGLELEPHRLWVLRRSVFLLGGFQVLVTGGLLAAVFLSLGLPRDGALVAGFALAMSSTAIVLQTLSEKNQLTTRHGREAFAILLFQDIAVIPLLALLPLLAQEQGLANAPQGITVLKILAVFGLLIVSSRALIRPLFRYVTSTGAQELGTALALFLVAGVAFLMDLIGLSMALGAFVAGVLLADSEYRHDLEASVQPFKGLLLGLFFMAVGMSADLGLLLKAPALILAGALALMLFKFLILLTLGKLIGNPLATAVPLGVALAQGGEFAFVVFTAADGLDLLSQRWSNTLVLIVTVSMALTPAAFALFERFLRPRLKAREQRAFDTIPDEAAPVVIAGFGRFGQVIGRILRIRHIPFTALDNSTHQVDFVRRFGNNVYYGDPSRLELLQAAGIDKARVFVLAIDDVDQSIRTAALVRRHYPRLSIYARARNRNHVYRLMELGVEIINREMFLASVDMAGKILRGLDFDEAEVQATLSTFVEYDERLIRRQQAIYQNEVELIESTRQAQVELEHLFERDSALAAEVPAPDATPSGAA